MTSKQYIADTKRDINAHTVQLTEAMNKKKRAFNIGSIVMGALGACVMFSNFWFALPCFGAALGLFMERNKQLRMFEKSIDVTKEQISYLDQMQEKGIDVSEKANAERKKKMDALEITRRQKHGDTMAALSKNNFANMLVAGTTAAAWIVGGPVLSLIPLATLIIKSKSDSNYMAKHAEEEEVGKELNHNIYGYNVSNYVNYNRAVAQQKAAQQQRGTAYAATKQRQTVNTTVPQQPQKAGKTITPAQRPTTTRTTTKQTTAQPSKTQQDAVNRYVEMLAQQKGQTTPTQKRKV